MAARVILEVTAGLIPGEPMDEYTRRWSISDEEISSDDARVYNDAQGAAMNYCLRLQNPHQINWVRMEWIWL